MLTNINNINLQEIERNIKQSRPEGKPLKTGSGSLSSFLFFHVSPLLTPHTPKSTCQILISFSL